MRFVPKCSPTLKPLVSADVTATRMMETLKLLNLNEHIHLPRWFTQKDNYVLGKTEKLAYLMKNKFKKKILSFSLSSVRQDLNCCALTLWNSSSSLQSTKSLLCQQNLCRLERQKHSQHFPKNGIFYVASGFCSILVFLLFEEHKIRNSLDALLGGDGAE